ncbi:hypothetical protein P3342_007290 [Pyrenophora teres f. teres]|nr:hypothetical protein P3342_007290 [Pyrenophora teres f. teres]
MQSHIAAVSDNLWRLKLSNKRRDAPQHTTTPSFTSSPEPMDWEPSRSQAQRAKWVSQQEIDRRRDDGSCLRCGKKARATKAIGKTKPSAEPYNVEDDATTISPDEETEKE